MKPFLISYDLDKPGQNYTGLIARLKEIGAVRVLMSQWVVEQDCTCADLRDDLKAYMDSNDRILVTRITGWASSKIMAFEEFKQIVAA